MSDNDERYRHADSKKTVTRADLFQVYSVLLDSDLNMSNAIIALISGNNAEALRFMRAQTELMGKIRDKAFDLVGFRAPGEGE